MSTLWMPAALQDENSGSMLLSRKQATGDENAVPTFGIGKVQGKVAGLGTARKALGNITNQGLAPASHKPGALKTPGTGLKARKALGDITNATPKQSVKEQQKPALLKPQPLPSQQPVRDPVRQRAELYAEEGIEKLAGKDWHELQRDRQRTQDEALSSSFQALERFATQRYTLPLFKARSYTRILRMDMPLQFESVRDLPSAPPSPARTCSEDLFVDDFKLDASLLPEVKFPDDDVDMDLED